MANKPPFAGKRVRLGDVCSVERAKTTNGAKTVWLLNLDKVEKGTGRVLEKEMVNSDALGSSTVSFSSDSVLYSKLRPNLNKVVLPDEDGCATSELLPLLPKQGVLDREYLVVFLRSKAFVDYATQSVAGSKMPRASRKTVLEAEVPLPDIDRQHIVASEFNAITRLTQLLRIESTLLDQLVKSQFVEMFGRSDNWKNGISIQKLGDVSEVGSSRRVFKNELVDEGVPFYRGTEISALSISPEEVKPELYITEEHYQRLIKQSGKPEIGDLLMPSICPDGQIWCVDTDEPFYFKDGRVLWVRPNREVLNGDFLRQALAVRFQEDFKQIASGTTFAELKIFILKGLDIPTPPLELQREFSDFVAQVDKSRFTVQRQIEGLQTLYDSLAQEYFG